MSRQQKRAVERSKNKTLQKIALAAGEGVSRAVALSFALVTNAFAAEPERKEDFTLPPVVVREQGSPYYIPEPSLSRIPVPLKDLPQSVTIVPQQVIEEQAAWSLKDALRNVPGIGIAAGEGGGAQGDSFTLRGYSARNDMFIDGVRDQGSYNRDVFNIESIEVLKGPSSTYFGRGSTGGIINQVSKTPRLDPSYGGTFGIGSGFYLRGTADINHPVSPTTAFRVNLMAQRADVVDRDKVEGMRFGIAPSIAFGLGTPTQLTFSYLTQYEDNVPDYGHPFVFGKPPKIDRDTFFGLHKDDYERTLVNIGTARLDHRFSDQLSLRNTLRYSHVDREATPTAPRIADPLGISPGDPLSSIAVNRNRPGRDTQESILSNQTDVTAKFDTLGFKHTFNTGVEFSRETFDAIRYNMQNGPQTNLADPNPDDPVPTARAVSAKTDTASLGFGIFAADQLRLNDYFDVVGGVRWDYFNTDFDNKLGGADFDRTDKEFSYRGGLIFHPTSAQSYYFSYGTSFNPSAEALSLSSTNSDTAPEENEIFELGAKLEFMDGALGVQGALFRIDKTNARVPDPLDPTLPNVLEGEQRAQGVELGVTGRILPGWNLFAGYTFLDTETLKSTTAANVGKEIQNVPEHSANLWTTYDFLEKWQVGGGPTYVGRRYANANNTNRIPDHVRWDATVAYRLTEKIQLRLNAINLTDKYYYENTHPAHVVPGTGRTFIFSTNFKF